MKTTKIMPFKKKKISWHSLDESIPVDMKPILLARPGVRTMEIVHLDDNWSGKIKEIVGSYWASPVKTVQKRWPNSKWTYAPEKPC